MPTARCTGDVRLLGSGDPTLSGRAYPWDGKTERPNPPLQALQEMADQIVARGVKTIAGDVIGDDTWFVWERYGGSWAWDDLQWEYGAPVSALTRQRQRGVSERDDGPFRRVERGGSGGQRGRHGADFADGGGLESRRTLLQAGEFAHARSAWRAGAFRHRPRAGQPGDPALRIDHGERNA